VPDSSFLKNLLEQGLGFYQLNAHLEQSTILLAYVELLEKWNRTYNLTAIKDKQEMVYRHILDSLSIHQYIAGENCLDVGSGAGLPGLVLSIVQPDKHWTLLDSNSKRTRFLRHVKAHLDLHNVEVVQQRIDEYQPEKLYSTITCRAFSSMNDFVEQSGHCLEKSGLMLAMKAHLKVAEWEAVKSKVADIERIYLATMDDEKTRCLVKISL